MGEKILIIRFSSFGDVVQGLSIPAKLREKFSNSEIHWVTRSDFSGLVGTHPLIQTVFPFQRSSGLKGLIRLAQNLSHQNYTRVYDAHNNFRSLIIRVFVLGFKGLFPNQKLAVKSQKRWKRFLLFRFRWNLFQQPFSGQRDLLEPLKEWGISDVLPPPPQIFPKSKKIEIPFEKFSVLAASAAHPLKRWPLDYWKALIRLAPHHSFVLLGGAEDHFLKELEAVAPNRVKNFSGSLSLLESAYVLSQAERLITNDTGLLHVAEQLGLKTIALMGPAPFGFPSRETTTILQRTLPCRPCSKHGQGPCTNPVFQTCLTDIKPEEVLTSF